SIKLREEAFDLRARRTGLPAGKRAVEAGEHAEDVAKLVVHRHSLPSDGWIRLRFPASAWPAGHLSGKRSRGGAVQFAEVAAGFREEVRKVGIGFGTLGRVRCGLRGGGPRARRGALPARGILARLREG